MCVCEREIDSERVSHVSSNDAKHKGIWEFIQRVFLECAIHEEGGISNLTDPRENSSDKRIM